MPSHPASVSISALTASGITVTWNGAHTASSGFVSLNGTSTTWSANTSSTSFFNGNAINCIEHNGTVFLAGGFVFGGAVMAYSTNGSSWTLVTTVNALTPTVIYGVYWKA